MDVNDYTIPLSEIVARFPGNLFWKSKEGVYLGCNLEQAISFGFNRIDEIVGKTDLILFGPAEAKRIQQVDELVMRRTDPYIVEESVTIHGEENFFISKKSALHNAQGIVVGTIGIAINITERRRMENALLETTGKLERANEAKNEFISNMSHDLRTPLSGIQSLAETIHSETQDPRLLHQMELLLDASADLLKLVDGILDVIRIDAKADEERDREFNLRTVINNLTHILMPKVKEKGIDFQVNYDKKLPEFLWGQPLMLQRVMINLLSNSLKFTETEGQITLSLTAANMNPEECLILITISDTGIGIPKEKMDMIFDKFARISRSFKGQYKGTGVGLYMVKKYMDAMGGIISVDSVENEGTTFTCRIPLTIGTGSTIERSDQEEDQTLTADRSYDHLAILLVEDNPIAQHSQALKFESLGCSVEVAGTGKRARALFDHQRFDLLIVDLGLPDTDGLELAAYFRSQTVNSNSLSPIVILTAHADERSVLMQNEKENLSVIFKRKPLMLADAKMLLNKYIA